MYIFYLLKICNKSILNSFTIQAFRKFENVHTGTHLFKLKEECKLF